MATRTFSRRLCLALTRQNIGKTPNVPRCMSLAAQRQVTALPHVQQRSISYSPCLRMTDDQAQSKSGNGIIINIQDADDFEKRVMDSAVPVVIDFHAKWCGPCHQLSSMLEPLVADKQGKVILAKIDVDNEDNFDIVQKFSVSSIPHVVGIRKKEVTDKFIGLQDDDKIKTFLAKLIGWCGPCHQLSSMLEPLVADKQGKVILAKIDVDNEDNFDIVQKFSVSSIPHVVGIRKKEVTDKFIGLQDDDKIKTFLAKLIG